jgi:glucosamine--fructose-6-phosphate aminotransferase (isomerizing)
MSKETAGLFIRDEIASQGQAWEELIPLVMERADEIRESFEGIDEVIFTGCGSALNASLCGASILQMQTGISARAVPAAECYLFPQSVFVSGRKTLAVLISRSGRTTEVVRALDDLRSRGIRSVSITCTEDSPLARESDLALVLSPVTERAVATTRSLTGMILVTQLLAAIVSGREAYLNDLRRLPALCQSQMESHHNLGKVIGERADLTKYAFVGNGPFFGLARESQLKVKEMVLLPVDAYPMLDFRHGPQSNVDKQMLVVGFISDSAYEEEVQFLRDMKALGGVICALCDRDNGTLQAHADYVLELNSGLGELVRGPLYMPAVQYMAYYRSLSRGLNPDEPRHLSYWVDMSR